MMVMMMMMMAIRVQSRIERGRITQQSTGRGGGVMEADSVAGGSVFENARERLL